MKKIKALVVAMMLGLVAFLPVANANAVTCPKGTLRADKDVSNIAQCSIDSSHDNDKLMISLDTIINVILGTLGVVAVIMVIIGGFQYLTSAGDPGKASKGTKTILYGIIGLVIALLAYAIVNFVLANAFNNDNSGSDKKESRVEQSIMV